MKEAGYPDGGVKEKEDIIHVEIVGATLVARALKELLQIQPGFDVTDDASHSLMRRKIILIAGQDGMAVLRRRQLRSVRRRAPEQFALLTNGQGIDFRLARDLPIRVFLGTDDPLPVFSQGLRAAATGCSFCSPQVVPFLLAATFTPGRSAQDAPGAPSASTAALTPHGTAAQEARSAEPASPKTAAPVAGKEAALSEGTRRVLQRGLSDREAEIALQAGQGMSNQQIADANNVTLSTVKFHLYRVYQKLGIKRRSQLSQLTSPPDRETLV